MMARLYGGVKSNKARSSRGRWLRMPFALVALLLVMLVLAGVFGVFFVVRRWL